MILMQMAGSKGVCAKAVYQKDLLWECFDCQLQPLCIQCSECFEKSDHTGHRVKMHKDLNGSCDCGDINNWKPEGNCRDHQGLKDTISHAFKQMPEDLKQRASEILGFLIYLLKKQCRKLEIIRDDIEEIKGKEQLLIEQDLAIQFLEYMVDATPAFIVLFQQKIELDMPFKHKYSDYHTCSNSKGGKSGQANTSNLCECTLFDYLARTNHFLDEERQQKLLTVFLKILVDQKIKNAIGESVFNNFLMVQQNRDDKASYGNLMIQLYCNDIAKKHIVEQPHLLNNFFTTIDTQLKLFLENIQDEKLKTSLAFCYTEIQKMGGPLTNEFIIYQTRFIENLIEHLQFYYLTDKTEYLEHHTENQNNYNRKLLYDVVGRGEAALNYFLDQVDPLDTQINQKICGLFVSAFRELSSKFENLRERNEATFIVPLHHCFARYLIRLVMFNYFIEQQGPKDNENSQRIFGETFKQGKLSVDQYEALLEDVLHNRNEKQIILQIAKRFLNFDQDFSNPQQQTEMCKLILIPQIYSFKFSNEVFSGKYVRNGQKMKHVLNYQYQYNQSIYYSLGLIQIMIAIAPNPSQIVDLILDITNQDFWLQELYQQIKEYTIADFQQSQEGQIQLLDVERIKQSQSNFNDSKLRQIIFYQIRLLILLQSHEIPIFYPLIDKDTHILAKDRILELFKRDSRREIIHQLIQHGMKTDIEQIRAMGLLIYLNQPYYPDLLKEMTTQTFDQQKGKVIFELKQEYAKQYDPFHFLIPIDQEDAQKKVESLPTQKKSLLNLTIGDTFEHYQYGLPINEMIANSYGTPKLIYYLTKLLVLSNIQKVDVKSGVQISSEIIQNMILKLLVSIFKMMSKHQEDQSPDTLLQVSQVLLRNRVLENLIQHMQTQKDKDKQLYSTIENLIKLIGLSQLETVSDKALEAIKTIQQQSQPTQILSASEAAKKKQQEMMNKMKNQRKNFIEASALPQNQEEQKKSYEQSSENEAQPGTQDFECAFCREVLVPIYKKSDINKGSECGGRFGMIQTANFLRNSILKINDPDIILDDRTVEEININWEIEDQENGIFLTACQHFTHFECFTQFIRTRYHMMNQIGLNKNEFQCPACKKVSNTLIPLISDKHLLPQCKEQQSIEENGQLKDPVISSFVDIMAKYSLRIVLNHIELSTLKQNQYCESNKNYLLQFTNTEYLSSQENEKSRQSSLTSQDLSQLISLVNLMKREKYTQEVVDDKIFRYEVQKMYDKLVNYPRMHMKNLYKMINKAYRLYLAEQMSGSQEFNKKLSHGIALIRTYIKKIYSDISCLVNNSSQSEILEKIDCQIYHFYHITAFLNILNESFIGEILIHEIISTDQIKSAILKLNKATQIIRTIRKNPQTQQIQLKVIQSIMSELFQDFDASLKEPPVSIQIQDENQFKNIIDLIKQSNSSSEALSPYYFKIFNTGRSYHLVSLPDDYQQFIIKYYKQQCENCISQVNDKSCICLLCGKTFCMADQCCKRSGMGELSMHSLVERGVGIFIAIQTGNLILIEKGRSIIKPSIYTNEFGQPFFQSTNDLAQFKLNKQLPKQQDNQEESLEKFRNPLDNLKNQLMDFEILDHIISQRSIQQYNRGLNEL